MIPHFLYKFGQGFSPDKEVTTGNIYLNGRIWCMLDTLFTCDTILDAGTRQKEGATVIHYIILVWRGNVKNICFKALWKFIVAFIIGGIGFVADFSSLIDLNIKEFIENNAPWSFIIMTMFSVIVLLSIFIFEIVRIYTKINTNLMTLEKAMAKLEEESKSDAEKENLHTKKEDKIIVNIQNQQYATPQVEDKKVEEPVIVKDLSIINEQVRVTDNFISDINELYKYLYKACRYNYNKVVNHHESQYKFMKYRMLKI